MVAASWFFQYPGVKRWPVPLCPQPGTSALIESYLTKLPVPPTFCRLWFGANLG